MQRIKDIKPKELVPGITGYYAHGDKHTLGLVELKAGSIVPEHHHIHEQITYILEGQLDMMIGGRILFSYARYVSDHPIQYTP